jgi:hypothetical protein
MLHLPQFHQSFPIPKSRDPKLLASNTRLLTAANQTASILNLDMWKHKDNPDTILCYSPLTRMSEITLYPWTLSQVCSSLPFTNSLVRFSTRTAFLDSLITDPPILVVYTLPLVCTMRPRCMSHVPCSPFPFANVTGCPALWSEYSLNQSTMMCRIPQGDTLSYRASDSQG